MKITNARSLYICYFGVREPLVQTQVIPYLNEIAKAGVEISLLTFEPEDFDLREIAEGLEDKGISWHRLRYHKRPSVFATMLDIVNGSRYVAKLIQRESFNLIHARVHVPMLIAALARKLATFKPKILFDIRGFFPEEYVDAGIWKPHGMLFRNVKRVERWLMRESDGYVVLTNNAKHTLWPEPAIRNMSKPIEVIPCCVDFRQRFKLKRSVMRDEFRQKLGVDGRKVFVHLGALGGLYLTNEISELLKTARDADPSVFAMFLTQSDPLLIKPLLESNGFREGDFLVARVAPGEVAGYLCAADVGLSIVKSSYATRSRSPTKIPEYLACGLAIIANTGVGDVDELVQKHSVGALVERFDRQAYISAIRDVEALGDVSDRCRETAKREFDLETVGGVRYRRLYKALLEGD